MLPGDVSPLSRGKKCWKWWRGTGNSLRRCVIVCVSARAVFVCGVCLPVCVCICAPTCVEVCVHPFVCVCVCWVCFWCARVCLFECVSLWCLCICVCSMCVHGIHVYACVVYVCAAQGPACRTSPHSSASVGKHTWGHIFCPLLKHMEPTWPCWLDECVCLCVLFVSVYVVCLCLQYVCVNCVSMCVGVHSCSAGVLFCPQMKAS